MKNPKLRVEWCTYKAAKWAVEHWHYSQSMPQCKLMSIGIFEDDKFIGVILFGSGANRNIGSPYNIKQLECCELLRIACRKHITPVSKMVRIAISMLRQSTPKLRLIVSYADSSHKHLGIVYQAANFIYVGNVSQKAIVLFGNVVHKRSISKRYGTASIQALSNLGDSNVRYTYSLKYKYLYPLDKAMRRQILPLSKPYPKVLPERVATRGTEAPLQKGGANPTHPLQATS